VNKLPEDKVSFYQDLIVEKEHLDDLSHVNNIVYLKWVQQIAEQHWQQLAGAALRKNCIWVALRHEIDYLAEAFFGEKLQVCTWIDSSTGAKSIRMVRIYRDDTLLCACKTTWVLLDPITHKPKRIGEEIKALFDKL